VFNDGSRRQIDIHHRRRQRHGERAVEIAQIASIVIAAGMRVDELVRVPLSFPTYAGILGRAAANAAGQLNLVKIAGMISILGTLAFLLMIFRQ
jgi:hypothetical protein